MLEGAKVVHVHYQHLPIAAPEWGDGLAMFQGKMQSSTKTMLVCLSLNLAEPAGKSSNQHDEVTWNPTDYHHALQGFLLPQQHAQQFVHQTERTTYHTHVG